MYSIYILVCVKLKVPNTINLEFIDIKCDKKRTNMVALECVVGNGLIISEHVHSTQIHICVRFEVSITNILSF